MQDAQVEQDLVISRALVEMFAVRELGRRLTFREAQRSSSLVIELINGPLQPRRLMIAAAAVGCKRMLDRSSNDAAFTVQDEEYRTALFSTSKIHTLENCDACRFLRTHSSTTGSSNSARHVGWSS